MSDETTVTEYIRGSGASAPEEVVTEVEASVPEVETKPEEVKSEWTPSETERKAMVMGWKPEHEHVGDKKLFKSAELYIKDGELYSYISNVNKKLSEQEKALETLNNLNAKIAEQAYKRGMQEAESKLQYAASIGDAKAAKEAADAMVNMEKPYVAPIDTRTTQQRDAEAFQSFTMRNSTWWNDDTDLNLDMVNAAKKYSESILIARPTYTPEQHYQAVEQKVKEKFRETLGSPSQSVVPDSGVVSKSGKINTDKLAPWVKSQLRTMHSTVKNFNQDAFLKELQGIGEDLYND